MVFRTGGAIEGRVSAMKRGMSERLTSQMKGNVEAFNRISSLKAILKEFHKGIRDP